MMASEVIDLPDPLSPAMASVSPRRRVKERSLTSGFSPSSVLTDTQRPSTASTGASSGASAAPVAVSGAALTRTRPAGSRS